MTLLAPFLIIGLVTGSVYGLAAVGLVLTYKTSGVFNFAHGSLAAIAAYVFYTLHVQEGLSWPLAAAIAVFGVGPILSLAFERFAKAISGAGLALKVTATIGVLLVVNGAIILIYGVVQTRTVPVFVASGSFTLGQVIVQNSQLATVVFAVVVTAALYLLFRFSRIGMAMRAVVESPDLLEISGTRATAVRRIAWLVGICLVSASGVLFSPLLSLDPTQLTLLIVAAFGAAAVGAFTSLPLAFAGGLAVGVAASVATKYFTTGFLVGVPSSVPFIILLVVLLVFPRRYLAERSFVIPVRRNSWAAPSRAQLLLGVAVLIFLILVPSFAGIHLTDWTVGLSLCILFLSLGLLVRASGQVSLCHVTFLAIGACAFGHLTQDWHIPWLIALLLAFVIAVPIGALLAIPAIRLSPLYLSLATFGFGIFVQYMFYEQNFMFGSSGAGLNEPAPAWLGLGSDTGYYYLVLVLVVAASALVVGLMRTRLGRLLRGLADSPTAIATSGATTNVTWVLVFSLSAGLAAIAGALGGVAQTTVSITSYPPLLSLTYLAVVVITVGGAPWYAIAGGLAMSVIPSYFPSYSVATWLQVVFGAGAVLYAVTPESKRGAPLAVRNLIDKVFRTGTRGEHVAGRTLTQAADVRVADSVPSDPLGTSPATGVRVEHLTVRFGGLVAVSDVSLTAPPGRITGLIGPNGAGKTTIFNACSGLVKPTGGRVFIGDEDVSRASVAGRAQRGLGRTFQQIQLLESLTVWDNVTISLEAGMAGGNPLRHVLPHRADNRNVRGAAARALELCDLWDQRDVAVAELSTGQRRLVELARSIAGPFGTVLLDEPASGLDRGETLRLGAILTRIVEERGIGILLVEHDMSLVMKCCEHIYVVDFGRLIFEGSQRDVAESELVRAAYLGSQEVAGKDEGMEPANDVEGVMTAGEQR